MIWRDGKESQQFSHPLTSGLYRVDSAGDDLLLWGYDFLERLASVYLLDIAECEDERGEAAVLTGMLL